MFFPIEKHDKSANEIALYNQKDCNLWTIDRIAMKIWQISFEALYFLKIIYIFDQWRRSCVIQRTFQPILYRIESLR